MLDAVDVVHLFMTVKRSAQELGHNESVLRLVGVPAVEATASVYISIVRKPPLTPAVAC